MSEVKRYAIYSGGKWEAVVVKAGPWVKWRDFEAQRLRADTAEAELKETKLRMQYNADTAHDLSSKLDAAEQRIAELTDVERITMQILGYDKDPAPGIDWLCSRDWSVNTVREIVRAALNPNPEAESHE